MTMPRFAPHTAPTALRLAAYVGASLILLYLTLAPGDELPTVHLWDKVEHALAWTVLAGIGLVLWPRRPWAITAYALGFGVLVEMLQSLLPFGRQADARDLIADLLGTMFALFLWAVIRRLAR